MCVAWVASNNSRGSAAVTVAAPPSSSSAREAMKRGGREGRNIGGAEHWRKQRWRDRPTHSRYSLRFNSMMRENDGSRSDDSNRELCADAST